MPLGVGDTNKELTIANSQSPPDKKGFFLLRKYHQGTLKRRNKTWLFTPMSLCGDTHGHVPMDPNPIAVMKSLLAERPQPLFPGWVDGCYTDIAWLLLSILITDVLYLI